MPPNHYGQPPMRPPQRPQRPQRKTWPLVLGIVATVAAALAALMAAPLLIMVPLLNSSQSEAKETINDPGAVATYRSCIIQADPQAFTGKGVVKTYKIDQSSITSPYLGIARAHLTLNNDRSMWIEVQPSSTDVDGKDEWDSGCSDISDSFKQQLRNKYGPCASDYTQNDSDHCPVPKEDEDNSD